MMQKVSGSNTITDLDIYNHQDNIKRPDLTYDFITNQEEYDKAKSKSGKSSMFRLQEWFRKDPNNQDGSDTDSSHTENNLFDRLLRTIYNPLQSQSTKSSQQLSKTLIENSTTKTSIFSALNHTITYDGHYSFKELLETPHSDQTTLMEKQELIIKLYKNPGNITLIRQGLKTIASVENHVSWIWGQHNQETLDYIEKLFFSFNILNRKVLLDFHTGMEVYAVPLSTIIIPIMTFCVTNYLIGSPTSVIEFIQSFLRTTVESYRFILTLLIGNESISKYGAYLITLLYIIFYVYKTYVTFNQSYKLHCQHAMIRSYFVKVHKFATTIMDIYQNDLFVRNIKHKNNCADKVQLVSGALSRTLEIFDTSKYTAGYCLLLWKNRQLYMKDISILQWYCGRVDAWTSLVPMMKSLTSNSTDDINISIPRFQWPMDLDDQDGGGCSGPMVSIEGMWHPSLAKCGNIVKNDIKLGNGNPNNIILTGPNAAGKSTLLKSLTLNVYLAHTLGVVCCDDIVLTPINVINTYMNIPDCIGKESLFEAEMNRSLQQLKCVEDAQNKNQYVFSVMDEIFTGTNYHEGVAGAYAVCKKLHQYKNSVNVISTHFSFLTDLEKEYPDSFGNHRMEINLPSPSLPSIGDAITMSNRTLQTYQQHDTDLTIHQNKSIGHESIDHESINHESIGHESIDHESINHESIDHESIDHESIGHESLGHESLGHESLGHESLGHESLGHESPNTVSNLLYTPNNKHDNLIEIDDSDIVKSTNIYTYKIKPGINQHKIALDLLKNKGFPRDVVDFSNEAINKINKLSYTV